MTPSDMLVGLEWFLGIMFAIIGTLIVAVCIFFWRYLEGLTKRLDHSDELREADRREAGVRRDELGKMWGEKFERQSRDVSDIRETVAGFGVTYLPRREWELERARLDKER